MELDAVGRQVNLRTLAYRLLRLRCPCGLAWDAVPDPY